MLSGVRPGNAQSMCASTGSDLARLLLARIAEEEARAAQGAAVDRDALRARRRVVEAHRRCGSRPCYTLRLLAELYPVSPRPRDSAEGAPGGDAETVHRAAVSAPRPTPAAQRGLPFNRRPVIPSQRRPSGEPI